MHPPNPHSPNPQLQMESPSGCPVWHFHGNADWTSGGPSNGDSFEDEIETA